jgi:hypothetical protein
MRDFLLGHPTSGKIGTILDRRVANDNASAPYPKPGKMLLRVGSMILIAAMVGVATDYLIQALTR